MSNIEINWLLTGRNLLREQRDYAPSELDQIIKAQGNWEKASCALGFTESEIEQWKKGQEILEVGPGKGYAFFQLRNLGVAVKAIEPILSGPEISEDVRIAKSIYLGMEDEVKGYRAVDAPLAFGVDRFDVAFATGPNFQNFTATLGEVKGGIKAVVSTLKRTHDSYLTFEINADGSIKYSCHYAIRRSRKFQLTKYLSEKHIPYEIVDHFNGLVVNSKAIRIYRLSPNGTDSLNLFNKN